MGDCACFENRYMGNCIVGSNPTSSARIQNRLKGFRGSIPLLPAKMEGFVGSNPTPSATLTIYSIFLYAPVAQWT